MDTLPLFGALAAGAALGAGAVWWYGSRAAGPAPAPEAGGTPPGAVAGPDEVRLNLDGDGRLASFEGPIAEVLGEQAVTGEGKAFARLRLQALRLQH